MIHEAFLGDTRFVDKMMRARVGDNVGCCWSPCCVGWSSVCGGCISGRDDLGLVSRSSGSTKGYHSKCPVLAGWRHAFFVPQMPPKGILSLSWVGFWPSKKWLHQVVLFFPFVDWHHRCCPLRGGCISWWDEDDECSRPPHDLAFLTCGIVTHEGASVWLERSQSEKVDISFGSTDWQTTGKPPVDLHFIVSPSPCALKLFRLGVGTCDVNDKNHHNPPTCCLPFWLQELSNALLDIWSCEQKRLIRNMELATQRPNVPVHCTWFFVFFLLVWSVFTIWISLWIGWLFQLDVSQGSGGQGHQFIETGSETSIMFMSVMFSSNVPGLRC